MRPFPSGLLFRADHPSRVTLRNNDWITLLDEMDSHIADLRKYYPEDQGYAQILENIANEIYGQLQTGEDPRPSFDEIEEL
jgi:hypothetical protein